MLVSSFSTIYILNISGCWFWGASPSLCTACGSVAAWGGIWRPCGELDTCKCKSDRGMPDLQVVTLLFSLGFHTVEEEEKVKGTMEETLSLSVCYQVLVAVQLLVTFCRVLFSLKLFRCWLCSSSSLAKPRCGTLYVWFVMGNSLFLLFFQTSPPKSRYSAS